MKAIRFIVGLSFVFLTAYCNGQGTFSYDTFSDTNGAPLNLHVGQAGACWVACNGLTEGFNLGNAAIDNGKLRSSSTNVCVFRSSAVPSNRTYSVTAVFHYFGTTGNSVWVCGRLDDPGLTGFRAGYVFSNSTWNLQWLSGGWTAFPNATIYTNTLTPGSDYIVKLDMLAEPNPYTILNSTPDIITVSINGTVQITGLSTNLYQTMGVPGCPGLSFDGAGATSNGIQISSFTAIESNTPSAFSNTVAFVVDGESNMSAHGREGTPTVSQMLCGGANGYTLLWSTDHCWDYAQSGETIASMLSQATNQVDPVYPLMSNFPYKVAILFGGLNDLTSGTTASNVWLSESNWCFGRHQAGFKTIIATVPAFNTNTFPAYFAPYQALNALLQGNHSFSDYFVDVASLPQFQLPNNTNTFYYQSDQTHLTTNGAAALAAAIASALPPAFGPTGYRLIQVK